MSQIQGQPRSEVTIQHWGHSWLGTTVTAQLTDTKRWERSYSYLPLAVYYQSHPRPCISTLSPPAGRSLFHWRSGMSNCGRMRTEGFHIILGLCPPRSSQAQQLRPYGLPIATGGGGAGEETSSEELLSLISGLQVSDKK